MLWPSTTFTIALRTALVVPAYLPIRFAFGRTFTILTFSTLTPNIASIACFTCVLFASFLTSKVYLLSKSVFFTDFSVMIGLRMISLGLLMQLTPRYLFYSNTHLLVLRLLS